MPNLIFMVHKNSTNQTNIAPAEAYPIGPVIDPQVTFTHAIRNDLNGSSVPVFDLAKGRIVEPGLWRLTLSINVINPASGGKYYALINRNNVPNLGTAADFELLRPNRMAGSGDTVGTSVDGLANIRDASGSRLADFLTPRIQISNVSSGARFNLGGIHYETYLHGERIDDPHEDSFVENPIPDSNIVLTSGSPTSSAISAGAYTYCDLSYSIPQGTAVKSLYLHASQFGEYKLHILKRTSATIFDVVASTGTIFHAGEQQDGECWQGFPITSYTIPVDAYTYHLAASTNGQTLKLFDLKARGTKSGFTISGTGNNLAVTSPAIAGYYVVGTGYGY